MKCKKIEYLLNRFVDNELPADKIGTVQGHLSSCKNCTDKLNELKQLKGMVKFVPEYTANPYLWTRIEAALDKIPVIPRGILIPKVLKLWVPIACSLILVSSIILVNINRMEASIQENAPSIQQVILEIPAVPENLETIALNLMVYTDNKMEVNYALLQN